MLNLYSVFIFLNIVIFASGVGEGIYTIVAPGTIHPNFKYNVAVSLHKAEGPCEIEVGITSPSYNMTKVISMQPMTMENVEFETMELDANDEYKLTVKGISGITIDNSTNLNFASYDPVVRIQTDKPIYAPGDLVQFRIIFLDEYACPEEVNRTFNVFILDDAYIPVKRWINITLIHGVFTESFQLSNSPINKLNHINVFESNKSLEIKSFKISKYELPKFDVSLDIPNKKFPFSEEVIALTVKSRYTFGKPVKGKAYIAISSNWEFILNKTIAINGKAFIELDVSKDLLGSESINEKNEKCYDVYVTVEEPLSGEKHNAPQTQFCLIKNDVVVSSHNAPVKYKPGKVINYMLTAKKFDGTPIQDNENPVELKIGENVFYSFFNENGIANFTFVLREARLSIIYYKYLNLGSYVGTLDADLNDTPDRFELNVKTQKPQLKKDLLIEFKWNEPISYFIYTISARGNIVQAERIEVPSDSKSYTIKVSPTLEMIPEAKILVQYIYDNNLRFEEETILFEEEFQNTLQISTVAQASPGDDIEFRISTDPNSYVGLLGLDQSVLLLADTHDFHKHEIFHGLEKYRTRTPPQRGNGRYPGQISGLVTLTNAHFPFNFPFEYNAVSPEASVPNPRIDFPETWIFENFNGTNQTQFSFVKKIPETITSWIITGFSMNSKTGIALTNNPTKVQVLKPFFISVNLPYSVKQGEVISISVLIFNYMNDTINGEVIMENSDEEYEFVEATNANEARPLNKMKHSKRFSSLSSDDVGSVSFMIKPKTVGITTIKVTAITAMAGDIVHQKLKVEPEGVKQHRNNAFFVNLNNTQEQHMETITMDVPDIVVPNSERIELSAVGDLVGLSIKYLENLVRFPTGTGEQNMIHFVPSILVLNYLKTIDQIEQMPNITETAINILKIGFQREMNFRHIDGSFSAYGPSDVSGDVFEDNDDKSVMAGSTWLTAYVAKSFQQAYAFIDIHPEILLQSMEFLANKQTVNGNFAEYGYLLEFPRLNDATITAYVLLAFMEIKEIFVKYETNIKKGIQFLINNVEEMDDVYSLSITALVLQKVGHPLADKVLTKLKTFAMNENGFTWWSIDAKKQKRQALSHAFKSSDIEITSYALQAILENGTPADVLPIIKWLTMQRNSNGGFKSTQDTVVGLEALIRFAAKTGLARAGAMHIDYACEGIGVDEKGSIMIMPDSLLVLNTHELPKNTRKVTFTAKGNSSSLVQLSYSYNTIDKLQQQDFHLNITVRADTPPKKLIIDICAKFVPSDIANEVNKTNLIVIEAALPSGFTADKEKLESIRDFSTILFTETKRSDTIAIVYLHSLDVGKKKCITIEASKDYDVAIQKPASVVVYDYYNKERSVTAYYEIKTSLCDICEGDDCAVDCKKNVETTESPIEVM